MTTYRERREARAERLEEWAAKRVAKAEAIEETVQPFQSDIAFITQPGHKMQRLRDKVNARGDKAWEHQKKAKKMQGWADTIKGQLDNSIYDDDPDAIERLQERIADLEAERDRIKAFNASCRKGSPDLSLLDDVQRKRPDRIRQPFVLKNLSANIRRNKQRMEKLEGMDR